MESVMKALKALEEEVVCKLSIMYKFDKKEALRRLHEKEEPSIPLPFTGEINKFWCLGMKKSHGLYNQCTGKRINERLCNKCQKEEEKLGKVKEGYIEERLSCDLMDYKDVKSYGSVLEKLKITKEKALEEAARFNVVIPEEQFEINKKVAQRGRPAKKAEKDSKEPKQVVLNQEKKEDKEEAKIGENTPEGLGDVNPPKKRGRPKKEQKKVVNNCGEELIEALVKEAEKEETEDVFETAKKAKAEAKKKEQAEKKQKEEEKKLELEQAKQAEKKREEEAKKLEEQKKIEEEEAIKKEEEGRASATEGNSKFPCDELCEEEVESEEEEEITVSKFEFNGKKYLKSSDNILYDPISQDPVGIWNEDDECIDEIEEDDE